MKCSEHLNLPSQYKVTPIDIAAGEKDMSRG